MKVHHLNCATLCPPFARQLVHELGHMVCHCLLIETADGLVLVDTGLGTDDVARPWRRLGPGFVALTRPRLDLAETALRQVERLGFRRADVRSIIPTHLDADHAGGIPDFPDATVHVHEAELAATRRPRTAMEKERYRRAHLRGARWQTHTPGGERWFGFEAVRPIDRQEHILLVPLVGHTRGHCGVAVKSGDGWLFHCGDAYFHAASLDSDNPRLPLGLELLQWADDTDRTLRKRNQLRLRDLVRDHPGEVKLFCAHDPSEFRIFA